MAATVNPIDMEQTAKAKPEIPTAAYQDSRRKRAWQACLFWLLCLTLSAAGHRLYKFVVSTDRTVSAEFYQTTDGAPLVWVGYGEPQDAASRIEKTNPLANSNEPIDVLPNSPFWIGSSILFTALGILLVWSGRWIQDHGIQSLLGLFGGHCFWIGSIEFGLDATGRSMGLAGSLEVVGDKMVGTHSAGTLIQASLVFLIPVLVGLTFHESNRCVVFKWFRQRLPILRNPNPGGRVENYAARTAIQFFMTVWFCYVAVLWLADPMTGSFGHWALLLILIAIVIGTPYMVWRTVQQSNMGKALRFSVSGAILTWSAIEIASSMQLFDEPWLSTSKSSLVFFLLLSLALTGLTMRELAGKNPLGQSDAGVATPVIVLLLVLTIGCSAKMNSIPVSPDEVLQALKDYDAKINALDTSVYEASSKALHSNDTVIRAQAAIAFGKSMELTPDVYTQLRKMAIADSSKLAQIAAIIALWQHDWLDEHALSAMDQLKSDAEWSHVILEFTD